MLGKSRLRIRVYPDPVLREKAKAVENFGEELRSLAQDMLELMEERKGVGLAAPQVGLPLRLFVARWDGKEYVVVNPVLLEASGEQVDEEGCLSFPGVYQEVPRPQAIRVSFQDALGNPMEEELRGFWARIFSHEMDHLDGKLLLDYMSPAKRVLVRSRMKRRGSRGE